jgi:glycosyltransferase involved in cell wall biosynthesis
MNHQAKPVSSDLLTLERDASAGSRTFSLVVVVPCLNEERSIGRVIAGIPGDLRGVDRVDVLVMDDGSTDATADRAREAGADVISHAQNLGLGTTFSNAISEVLLRGADIMVHIDGDGQFDPGDIPTIIAPIVAGRADMVTASRFLDPSLVPEMPAIKRWGNRGVASIVKLLTGKAFRDVSCGFRAYSRETLLRMNLFGTFTYTQESFLDLIFKNLTIVEVPVKVRGVREFGKSRVASNVARYGVRSLKIMLRAFISYRPFRFFSAIAAVSLGIGLILLGFLAVHYLRNGAFSPHIWAGFVGGSFCFLGFMTLITGLLGDMLVRMRMNQEEILYRLKKFGNKASGIRDL